jgi:hypothetical protein
MIQGKPYNQRSPDQAMPAAEHTQLRNHLASKHEFTVAQLNAAVGAAPGGQTRRQIANALRAWLKAL